MKILIVSQYFWPESFRINDLAIDLVRRGHEVTVLTGKPNYPQGKIFKGYGFFSHSTDFYNGIKIYRVPLIPRGKGTGFQLSLNYLSYVFFSCLFILLHRQKYDVSLTFAISPIIQVYPALLHKKILGSKVCIWMQDLWPESVSVAGNINSKFLIGCLTKMVKNIYKNCDKVLVQSKAFIPSIEEKGVTKKQIRYVPNWAEDLFANINNVKKDKFSNLIPKGFIIMFAGNIGEAQDFNAIIKAANITKNISEIKWVFVGDGRKKKLLENIIIKLGLQKTMVLLGRYPVEEMPNFFIHADIMLLSLKNEDIFSMTIPSKIQSYMSFGKPIIGMLNGVGAKVIKDADCGYVCNANDYYSLAKNAITAYESENKVLQQFGENGKSYYSKHFSKEFIINDLINIFEE